MYMYIYAYIYIYVYTCASPQDPPRQPPIALLQKARKQQ